MVRPPVTRIIRLDEYWRKTEQARDGISWEGVAEQGELKVLCRYHTFRESFHEETECQRYR